MYIFSKIFKQVAKLFKFCVIIFLAKTSFTNTALHAEVISDISKEQNELIFNKVKSFPENTQLAIALIENGEVKFIGVKREKDTIQAIDNYRSIFEIGSISKVFTSTLLANYIKNNELNLDDSINSFYNYAFNENQNISLIELANHTSGLPRLPSNLNLMLVNPDNPYKEYGESQLKDYLINKMKLNESKKYEYSNLGAGLLAYTLTKVSKLSYEEMLREKIFQKYKMNNSTTKKSHITQPLVKGINQFGMESKNWEFDVLAGAGAILSTSEDLSKFALAHFDKINIELELTRKITHKISDNMSIGLGWHLIKNKNGKSVFWHNGSTGGYSSSMILDIENQNSVVILSNVSAFNPNSSSIDKLCFELMDSLNKK